MLDAIELLTKQHREAQDMIARLAGDEAGGEARHELFAQLKDALAPAARGVSVAERERGRDFSSPAAHTT